VKEKQPITRIIDKRDKISANEMRDMLFSAGLDAEKCDDLEWLINRKGRIDDCLSEIESMIGASAAKAHPQAGRMIRIGLRALWRSDATQRLRALGEMIDWYGISKVVSLDLGIMRGFDYYTSFVMEAHDARGEYRALFGGGRYDGLVSLFGGPSIPAVGFAVGDAILEMLMKRAGSWPKEAMRTDCMVAVADDSMYPHAVGLASKLRERGIIVELDVMGKKLAKQLAYANALRARWTLIVGPKEWAEGKVAIRDMKSGEQRTASVTEALGLVSS
jgi:histidyl-tRNA synthetase